MSVEFNKAFEHTVGLEGKYSDLSKDLGGKTMYGITEAVAREFGYKGDMRNLPLETAKAIYKKNYWDKLKLDSVATISGDVAKEMFDTGVNCGITYAARFLQRSLNLLNREQKLWTDITVDGIMGSRSISALQSFFNSRKEAEVVMLRCLNGLQLSRYADITESRESNEEFFFGWVLNRVT